MKELQGHLSHLSEKSMKILLKYFEAGILSSEDQNFVLDDLIKQKDMYTGQYLQD